MLPGLSFTGSDRIYTLDIASNVENLFIGDTTGSDFLDNLAHPIDLHVQIRSGVVIGAALNPGASTPDPAIFFDLPDGSRVFIRNFGSIRGGGGIGGNGDNGRRDTKSGNTFCGGGGGGGAGSSSQGGLHGPDGSTSADDGAAGTTTTGGAGGANDLSSGESDYERGAAAQGGGDAISFAAGAVTIYIDNDLGEIHAGGDGGEGGYQDGGLPGGAVDAEDGADLATSAPVVNGSTADPRAVTYDNGSTLTWYPAGGADYPKVRGVIQRRP